MIRGMHPITAYRKAQRLSQEAFAAIVGCTQARVSQLEKGDRPSVDLALRIEERVPELRRDVLLFGPATNDPEAGNG
jgi:transcriptional regulator with XRE-family HTH domain